MEVGGRNPCLFEIEEGGCSLGRFVHLGFFVFGSFLEDSMFIT